MCITITMVTGCATIISGSRQSVSISSEPDDATVYIVKRKGEFAICKTPNTVTIKRRTPKIVVKKEGYRDTVLLYKSRKIKKYFTNSETGEVTKKRVRAGKYYTLANWWYLGNLVLGGPLGMCVDLATGAYARLPNNMDVVLTKNNKTSPKPNDKPIVNTNSNKQIYKVTSESLNVRSGAGSTYDVIMKISKGVSVEVLDKSNTEWWKIEYNNEIGFVSSKYLSK